jgi:HEAT repeat protein
MRSRSEHAGWRRARRGVLACAGLVAACLAVVVGGALAASEGGTEPDVHTGAATWLTDFEEAARQSRIRAEPVLVVATMAQCPYCRMFGKTMLAPEVKEQLKRFVLFHLDLDSDWETARKLSVAAAPTTLLLTPNGVTAGRGEGYMAPEAFLAWLAEAAQMVRLLDPAALAGLQPAELAQLLGARDPVVREAATEALAARPATAPVVVEALAEGRLAAQLGALELLRLWGAPVEGLDPWKAQTVPPAIETLRSWAAHPEEWPDRPKPSAEEVERDLTLWADGSAGPDSRAAYERLARAGSGLLPRVRALTSLAWDRRSERLTALRYRLLMPASVAARFPQVPFQVAAPDARTRVQALGTLTQAASPALEGFFVEAFGDADPKVREAALRGLRKLGVKIAGEHVLRLLADPSPDVRATILKDLVESPMPDVVAELAVYALAEPDEALVIHATQALHGVRGDEKAFEALMQLTEHKSWQVRAAAVESFGSVSTSGRELRDLPKGKGKEIVHMLERALKDEDLFVVSKAIEVIDDLSDVDLRECADELAEVARTRQDLTLQALEAMGRNRYMSAAARDTIRELWKDERAEVRAAAVRALMGMSDSAGAEALLLALDDPDATVRMAACDAACELAAQMSTAQRERVVAAVRKQAAAENLDLRSSALLALAALGEPDAALSGIQELLNRDASYASRVARVAHSLPKTRRKEAFLFLRDFPLDDETWAYLFKTVFEEAPKSQEEFLWTVFDEDPHALASPSEVLDTMARFYGFSGLWDSEAGRSKLAIGHLTERARARLQSPNARRGAMALVLLCRAAPAEGEAEARRIVDSPPDSGTEEELRRAALDVLLCIGLPRQEPLVMSMLQSNDEEARLMAFRSLLRAYSPFGASLSVRIGGQPVWATFLAGSETGQGLLPSTGRQSGKPWSPPELPGALSVDLVRPFLSATDPEVSAGAAYLMVLLGDAEGLPRLTDAWRGSKDSRQLQWALAQAIAAANDDASVGLVREIYQSLDADEKAYAGPELYWRIRRMDGPDAKQLRQEMRTELGRSIFE